MNNYAACKSCGAWVQCPGSCPNCEYTNTRIGTHRKQKKYKTTASFKEGDIVIYRRLKKKATVIKFINFDDKEDLNLQGVRYYIKCGRDIWSVPEWALRRIKQNPQFEG